MRLAALFSGGKDSTFAIYKAKQLGHDVVCLLTSIPESPESTLLHHPNMKWTQLQSSSMEIPQLFEQNHSVEISTEIQSLENLFKKARSEFGIEGIVHGGIQSNFQRNHFEQTARMLDLQMITPLWGMDSKTYMHELLDEKFQFIITSVSADGLNDTWLGKIIEKNDLLVLEKLSQKFGFNMNFEGGEAETFVIDCPMFKHPINILKSQTIWDGYRGRFEIVEANLKNHA